MGARDYQLRKEELRLRRQELELRQWEAKYRTKGEFAENGIKGLVLINGGSAVALATLFQALLSKTDAEPMLPYVLVGIAFNVLGVAVGSLVFWIRYEQTRYESRTRKYMEENPWWRWVWRSCFISLGCFVVGLGVVVYGGLFHLG